MGEDAVEPDFGPRAGRAAADDVDVVPIPVPGLTILAAGQCQRNFLRQMAQFHQHAAVVQLDDFGALGRGGEVEQPAHAGRRAVPEGQGGTVAGEEVRRLVPLGDVPPRTAEGNRPRADSGNAGRAGARPIPRTTAGGVGPGLQGLLFAAGRNSRLLRGLVPAVPDSAVIDTGTLKVVYREAAPGVFEGVAVELGPRMAVTGDPTAYYPVLRGLEAGERVVTNGSFLIDAETRLNPAAGSIYFGGSGGKGTSSSVAVRPSTPEAEDALERKARAELAKLDAADRRLAEAQKFCPIRPKTRLGSMGPPFKLTLESQTVFLCCGGCEDKARADPKKTLAAVDELKKTRATPPKTVEPPKPSLDAGKEAEIRANLAKLPKDDRTLAEAQKYCPETDELLGSMGVPVKVMVKDQPVILCCKSCRQGAVEGGDETLKKVEKLKARAKVESHKHD